MLSQIDTLKILDCSKASLSDYVKKGLINRSKIGRRTYYDEHEVTDLAYKIKKDREKYRPDLLDREKQQIPIKEDREKLKPCSIILDNKEMLNSYGISILKETTDHLIELDIYEKVYQTELMDYAFNKQMYLYYSQKSVELDSVAVADNGTMTVHPYHKVAQDYHKKIKVFEDRYYLNPVSKQKLVIKEKPKLDEWDSLLGG